MKRLLAFATLALLPNIAHAGFILGYMLGSASSGNSAPAPSVPPSMAAPYQVPAGANVYVCEWEVLGCVFRSYDDRAYQGKPRNDNGITCAALQTYGLVKEIKDGKCERPYAWTAKPEHLVSMLTDNKGTLLEWFILSSSDAQGNIHHSALIVYR